MPYALIPDPARGVANQKKCNLCAVALDILLVLAVLHVFTKTEGTRPMAGVIRDAAGNLYGTTTEGGAFGWGGLQDRSLSLRTAHLASPQDP